MKQWQETAAVPSGLTRLWRAGAQAALARIISIRGGAYRGPSAKLLAAARGPIRASGSTVARGAAAEDTRLPVGMLLLALGVAAAWAAALTMLVLAPGVDGPSHEHAGMHMHGAAADPSGPILAWLLVMVVMMLPAEAPALLARARRSNSDAARSVLHLGGRVVVWAAFALIAAAAQVELSGLGLLDAGGVLTSPRAAASLLAVVGLFQLASLERSALARCQWGASATDGLAGGLHHGVGSFASCTLLMLVPLAVGGMSLVGMALLTALLAAEKVEGKGLTIARGAGFALLGLGVFVLVASG